MMRRTRQQLEDFEAAALSPCGQTVATSFGRSHPEKAHVTRTAFQRDRARIIHSRAFRRLEYKTQVFLNGTGDHFRTRLTHTIEVASVSRSVANALGLNEDLAEVIALAHDLGHSPVGHAGEDELDRLMADHGGFEHNLQSLRVVDSIENRHPEYDGLNLSYEVLEGLRKHDSGYLRGSELFPRPSLEAQVANLADEITYYTHDIDDGLAHGLLTPGQLAEVDLWATCLARVQAQFPGLADERLHSFVLRALTDSQVEDLVSETARRVAESGASSPDEVRRHPTALAGHSSTRRRENAQLRKFLYKNLYHHSEVSDLNASGCTAIRTVFQHYLENPGALGERTAGRLEHDGLHRTVCDYVSGMTDRYILKEATAIRA